MKYKLIAIDMDGTLLNRDQKVSKRNLESLRKAEQSGIHIVLATGRILESALYYSRQLKLNNPIIASNGAIISSSQGNNILYEKPIEYNSSEKVVQILEQSEMFYNFYSKAISYSKDIDEGIAEQKRAYGLNLEGQNIKMETFKDPMEFLNENLDIYKMILIDEDIEKIGVVREKLKEIENISLSSSWYNNVEIMKKGVSKGNALRHLCENLNINPSEVMAIGDNENDISMLELAGLSIAMENGEDIIKKYADIITDSNDENGVAKAIEKYVLT